MENHRVYQGVHGSIFVREVSQPENVLMILPEQNTRNPQAGRCGSDRRQFCHSPWPFGPIPYSPPNMTNVNKPDSSKNTNLTVCGNKCNGPQDCARSNGIEDCFCAVPSFDDARTLGLDPVAPVAVCLVLLKVISNNALSNIHVGTRDLGFKYVDVSGTKYVCRCNATFDAHECCDSTDGMIWLAELGQG